MKFSFNLVDQPWIPVRIPAGDIVVVSLREALKEAHRWQMVEDSNPLVLASLLRLLLAVVHRCVQGPMGLSQRQKLFDRGSLPEAQVDGYLSAVRHRFDLFGPEPFFQVGDLQLDKTTPLSKLAVECSSGNNKALFEHSVDSNPSLLSWPEAARLLLAHQAFSLCGGVSGGGLKNFTDSASPRGALIVVSGKTLFETLVANLTVYKDEILRDSDLPCWEREAVTYAGLKKNQSGPVVAGPCTLYTWISRAIRLVPEDDGCCRCYYASGWIPGVAAVDPAVSYRVTKEEGLAPVRISPQKAVWRDLCSLVPPKGQHGGAAVIHGLDDLRKSLAIRGILPLLILGQSAKPGKPVVESWTGTSLPLPESWLSDQGPILVKNVKGGLEYADKVAFALRDAIRAAARELTDKEQAGRMFESINTEADYWARLQAPFFALLPDMTEPDAVVNWRKQCRQEAELAYQSLDKLLGSRSDALRAWLLGELSLRHRLRKLEEEVPMRPTADV